MSLSTRRSVPSGRSDFATPRPGDVVATTSGKTIGHVIDSARGRFQVQLANGLVWLNADCVFTRIDQVVTLICEEANLGLYMRDDRR